MMGIVQTNVYVTTTYLTRNHRQTYCHHLFAFLNTFTPSIQSFMKNGVAEISTNGSIACGIWDNTL